MEFHLESHERVAEEFNTNKRGLTAGEVEKRMEQYGPNTLQAGKRKSVARMFFEQMTDFMIIILLAAAVVSGFVGELTDTYVILAIVLLNAIVGVVQEYRAEKAIEALQKMAANNARVIRDNHTVEIPAAEVVPGDVVILEPGNIVPADLRLFESHTLKINESALTGESVDVDKTTRALPPGEYTLGDRLNLAYRGTFVTHGRGRGYVIKTGMETEFGRIAGMIQTAEVKTPLQKRLGAFGKLLTVVVLILCAAFFFAGWARGEEWSTMLLTSISLAVAAIPEALPALVTVALALGAKKLVANNALIRKLPAVETLGSVTYICSDKTGTLTMNRMTVQEVYAPPEGDVPMTAFSGREGLLRAIALNNDVGKNGDGNWIGESTEVALARFAAEHGYERKEQEDSFPRIAEIPFDSKRKCMTTLHRTDDGVVAVVKGAVDVLLHKLSDAQRQSADAYEREADNMADRGYRTLGYAVRFFSEMPKWEKESEVESSLTLIGIAGLIDPPREEAKDAVAECKQAGIRPVMITGDHKLTARSIAKELGILTKDALVVTGPELQKMDDATFADKVERIRVYARVSPEQKLRIIHALQNKDHFVAMTGDGVNDAPALKNADIGIAMGINGTEVSKEAAHMILLDDNFTTIVKAVRHGRRIFDNILKFIKYIMTGNSGEIWALFLAPFLGLPIPLLAIHILWVNLITDGLPGLALASERAEPNIMERPPRSPGENVFSGGMGWHILFFGLLIGLLTLSMQWYAIEHSGSHWQTMAFSVLCFAQLFHVLAIRSNTESLFSLGLFSNIPMVVALAITVALQLMVVYIPFFNEVFRTQPLTWQELGLTVVVASVVFWAVEIEKWVRRSRKSPE